MLYDNGRSAVCFIVNARHKAVKVTNVFFMYRGNIARQIQEAERELAAFRQRESATRAETEKLKREIGEMENAIRGIQKMEAELRAKKLLFKQKELEMERIERERRLLERQLPTLRGHLQEMEREGRTKRTGGIF